MPSDVTAELRHAEQDLTTKGQSIAPAGGIPAPASAHTYHVVEVWSARRRGEGTRQIGINYVTSHALCYN